MTRYVAKYLLALGLCCCVAVSSAHAQAHIHGVGSVMLVQQGNTWQVEVMVPLADALGFEHAPETPEQKAHAQALRETLATYRAVLEFAHTCQQVSQSLTLFEPTHEHDEHETAHKHGHDHQHEHKHQDVTARFVLECERPVEGVTLTIFDTMDSLSSVQVQWISAQGQGAKQVSQNNRNVVF
ncbi:ZrgA family zinc uptake protein [Alteromonas oceanisediminis]|uniref:ZrgA family zinc uptake protein n=1 Tax=Alteromonas oceanisediminis TaxID=2836180 RepID=UPI001BD9A215|nr:DUF2796 domain-containing protein [Alteromonas oceanisediminis]